MEAYLSACLQSESLASPCADRMDRFATCQAIMRASLGLAVPDAANPQADSIFYALSADTGWTLVVYHPLETRGGSSATKRGKTIVRWQS
jgi:hypothetical protein